MSAALPRLIVDTDVVSSEAKVSGKLTNIGFQTVAELEPWAIQAAKAIAGIPSVNEVRSILLIKN
jgi:hypothetical protein